MAWAILSVATISKIIGLIGGNAANVSILVEIIRRLLLILAIWAVFYFHRKVTPYPV